MELLVKRRTYSLFSTIGDLFVDGTWECFTLEDTVRESGFKIYGETAIPAGRYRVLWTYSPHFNCSIPLLQNVLGFDGVRLHWGNSAKDTLGCILVGQTEAVDWVGASRPNGTLAFYEAQSGRRGFFNNGSQVKFYPATYLWHDMLKDIGSGKWVTP